jgi:hypothetical protein
VQAGQAAAAPPQAAPVPARLPDSKPNWTGFWTPVGGLMETNFGPGAVARPPGGGGGGGPRFPNLKSPYKERFEEVRRKAAEGIVVNDTNARCLPPGMPRMMTAIYGMELLQTPGQITITSEFGPAQRRIYTDGRPLPNLDEVLPTYAGYSIGRWEGDVLVAETTGVRDDVLLHQSGLPHSGNMRIVERFYQSEPGILTIDTSVTDPEAFAETWNSSRKYRFRPELVLQEFVCLENNRNVGPNGEPVFK